MMSAFTPLATFERTCRDVCLVPIPDITSLFDHLVGAHQDCFGNGDAEGFRGLEIDDQLEPRRTLDREVGRLCAAQDATDIGTATAKHIWQVRPKGDESARTHMRLVKKHCWQADLLRKVCNLCSVG